MNQVLKNILAVVAGAVLGSFVNMGIILISSSIIPPPAGADVTTIEGLKASMHLFEPKHFLFPFLAHAIGTFAGALLAAVVASGNKKRRALIIGVIFLIGGISNVIMLPSPTWFTIVDLVGAYIPFAWLAGRIACRKTHDIETV
ncbi:MAG: hypothetical protein EOO51_14055 [Flavobacterium sp.]|nr:MAG: hypothetical protein EOO51_14055 [Flavobacterium sp.]